MDVGVLRIVDGVIGSERGGGGGGWGWEGVRLRCYDVMRERSGLMDGRVSGGAV